jgi:biotin carboxyl carrier protein
MTVRKFRIRVNGVEYDVEAEEVETKGFSHETVAPRPPQNPSPGIPEPIPPAPMITHNGEIIIEAPLPGAVLEVKVQEGQRVEVGQVLIILEAMKMENEVTAPTAGKIKSLRVQKGSSVDANQVLVIVDPA